MKKIKAFSLLECVFSLFILGLFMSATLMLHKNSMYLYNHSLTQLKANYIRKVIEGYVATHGFLPYAANDLSGLEGDSAVGYLPYKTLGIDKSYAYDGSNKPFIFIANENLVLNFYKKQNFKIFPPFFPVQYCIAATKTWRRLFLYYEIGKNRKINSVNSPMYLWDYDDIDPDLNITLIKNREKLQLSFIHPFPILDHDLLTIQIKKNFANIAEWSKFYQINDLVAWVLIADNKRININSLKKRPITVNINSFFCVFWQSRFNLASQIKHPISSLGCYIGLAQKSFFQKRMKFLVIKN